ncbi:MAG: InlB B-repeat-containing protein, partial [Kiritimatiellae bacterium]|nr:InlB B-repeat-containing protein [Kiritimatiellia bacterium]
NGGRPGTQKTTNTIYAKYGAFPSVEWSGHVFQGWYNAAEGGKQVTAKHNVTAAPSRTFYAHWEEEAAAGSLSITGFAMVKPAGARGGRGAVPGVLSFEAEAGRVYELQWTPMLGGEWTVLKHWTAATDGPSSVELPATPGEPTGFFRLAAP